MNILVLGKFGPIEGGVSASTILAIRDLCLKNHKVDLISNSDEVEFGYRQMFTQNDLKNLIKFIGNGFSYHTIDQTSFKNHVPSSLAFCERLFGKACTLINEKNIELVVGWYYQPYGLVGAFLSQAFNVPLIVIHAGSDVGRLSANKDLFAAYNFMLKQSNVIISSSKDFIIERFGSSFENKIKTPLEWEKPSHIFTAAANKLEFKEYKSQIEQHLQESNYLQSDKMISMIKRDIEPNSVIMGVYGQCHEQKGLWDLITCLSIIRERFPNFHLMCLIGGEREKVDEFVSSIVEFGLEDNIWLIPFIPFLRIPEFIQHCEIVFVLERRFKIEIHNPRVPMEVLSMGKCLVVSREIVTKSILHEVAWSNGNMIIIEDPENHNELHNKLLDILESKSYHKIAQNGNLLYKVLVNNKSDDHPIASIIDNFSHFQSE